MNTKLIMQASAILLLGTGISLSFLPEEVLLQMQIESSTPLQSVLLQLMGALYFAFGMINWTAKGNLIGGIYARPVAIGNLCHFVIGFLALIKLSFRHPEVLTIVLTIFYGLFALCFTLIFFTHPVKSTTD
jgi:hypothetical protein